MFENGAGDSVKVFCECRDGVDEVLNTAKEYAPYGKIVLIFSEKSTFDYLSLAGRLKAQGNKTVCVALSEDVEFTTDAVCGLFTLHEDIRLAVALGDEISAFADYFATVRGVRCVVVTDNFNGNQIQCKTFIKNGNALDSFFADCNKSVVSLGKCSAAEKFALVIEKKFALLDYYVRALFFEKSFDVDGVRKILDCLDRAEAAAADDKRDEEYYSALCAALLHDRIEKGKFFAQTCVYVCEKILGKSLSLGKRLEVCAAVLDGKFDCSEPPDYNALAESVARRLRVDMSQPLKAFKERVKAFASVDLNVKDKFGFALDKTRKYLKTAFKTYRALGGNRVKLTNEEKSAIALSGDTFLGVNFMTVAAEINL